MMYDFEDYYEQEPSEIDKLIDETVEKVKDTILLRAKDEVESRTKEVEEVKKQLELEKKYHKYSLDAVKERDKQITDLQKQLDKKLQEIPHTKFNVGDTVYQIRSQWKQVKCPTCKGTGKVDITAQDGKNYKAQCPDCNNHTRMYEYLGYYVEATVIKDIYVHIAKDILNISYSTNFITSPRTEENFFIYTNEGFAEAKKKAEELTAKNKVEAEKKLMNNKNKRGNYEPYCE